MGNCASKKDFHKSQQELEEYKKANNIRFGVQQKKIDDGLTNLLETLKQLTELQRKDIKEIDNKLEIIINEGGKEEEKSTSKPEYIS